MRSAVTRSSDCTPGYNPNVSIAEGEVWARLSWATYSEAKFEQPRLAVVSMHSNKN